MSTLFMLSFSLFSMCPLLTGHRYSPFGPHPPPPPGHQFLPFLRDASPLARREYFRIVNSDNDIKAQILTKLEQWAQNSTVEEQYNNFTSVAAQRAEQFHDAVAGNLSGIALRLFNQLWSIRENTELTRLQDCNETRVVLTNGTAGDPLLHRLVPIPPPLIHAPPPRGCLFFQGSGPPHRPHFGRRGPPKGHGGMGPYDNDEMEEGMD